jgi:hypothetical protein
VVETFCLLPDEPFVFFALSLLVPLLLSIYLQKHGWNFISSNKVNQIFKYEHCPKKHANIYNMKRWVIMLIGFKIESSEIGYL